MLPVICVYFLLFLLIPNRPSTPSKRKPIQFKVVRIPKAQLPQTPSQKPKEIVLDPNMDSGDVPDDAKFIGLQDNKAKQQTRAEKSANIGAKAKPTETQEAAQDKPQKKKQTPLSKLGYESLLPGKNPVSKSIVKQAYDKVQKSAYIADPSLPAGMRTNVNVKKFRLAGYFIHIERAVRDAFFKPSYKKMMGERQSKGQSTMIEYSEILVGIGPNGDITKLELVGGSGNSVLNQHWKEVLAAAGPFPPLPKAGGLETLEFVYRFNVSFNTAGL